MKIPNRFEINNNQNCVEFHATSLRKAFKICRKMAKFYDAEARVMDSMTGVVHYIYREYKDKAVAKV